MTDSDTLTSVQAGTIRWDRHLPHGPVAVSAGGGLVAVAGAEGGCWLLDAANGAVVRELELPGGLLSVSFSPDEQLLALTGPTGYAIARVDDGKILSTESAGWCAQAAWTGSRVAITTGRRLTVLDTTGSEVRVERQTNDLPRWLVFNGYLGDRCRRAGPLTRFRACCLPGHRRGRRASTMPHVGPRSVLGLPVSQPDAAG